MADIIVMKPASQRANQENRIEETAKLLVNMTIKTLMQMYHTDCETARQLIVSVSESLSPE
jgi:hypothetical protein